jgi:MerR family transcriptional activator of bmr gene
MGLYYSIGQAAKLVQTTTETLRHYDRIGLVKPSKKDEWTKYRYYSQQDIVRLNTVRALHLMGVPLLEIKRVLDYDDLEKIVDFFTRAEEKTDEKIAALQSSKAKIERAKADYIRKLHARDQLDDSVVKDIPQRIILLSDNLEKPTVDNLWNYLHHFYDQVPADKRDRFSFEDQAGIYTDGKVSRLFAICVRFMKMNGVKTLPSGKYLCAQCTEKNREHTVSALIAHAKTEYNVEPRFIVQLIKVTGILQWNYEVQVFLGRRSRLGN